VLRNYFQGLKIYNQALKIYNQTLKIYFQALKIISKRVASGYANGQKEFLPLPFFIFHTFILSYFHFFFVPLHSEINL
jgi:hypothetical protein